MSKDEKPRKRHNHHRMKFPTYIRYKNPAGGRKRKFSLYKRFYIFILRLYHLVPLLPDKFIVDQNAVKENIKNLGEADSLTWLGHSSFLIKLNGKTILTDPFLSEYASPVQGIGPRRYTPPGLNIQNLPPIDIVLVSHDHYDHCDMLTIKNIPNKSDVQVVVPLRLGKLFRKLGYAKSQINELDWYESWSYEGITITALPAYHYSKRNLFTHNTSLWASFAISDEKTKLYFTGDTGYGTLFTEIGDDYGPFDYGLISIGAYDPPEYMQAGHLSPEQAVQVGKDIRANTLVAMHWGTIVLSDEPPMEPPVRFYAAAQSAGYPYYNIWIFNIGETRKL